MRIISLKFYGEISMYKYLLSLMVLLPLSTFVAAQDAEDEAEVEEVVTTGIKSSLKDAIDIKRKNVGVVEIDYNRDQRRSVFTIPGRSIITVVDSQG